MDDVTAGLPDPAELVARAFAEGMQLADRFAEVRRRLAVAAQLEDEVRESIAVARYHAAVARAFLEYPD